MVLKSNVISSLSSVIRESCIKLPLEKKENLFFYDQTFLGLLFGVALVAEEMSLFSERFIG